MFSSDLLIDELCTQGYHVIDNFFSVELYQQLQHIALKLQQQGALQHAKIGSNHAAQLNNRIRTDEIYWLDELSSEQAIQSYLQRMQEIAACLNQSLFLSVNEFETHFALYQPGSFYKKHVDQFQSKKNRKISCVYYLNDEWTNACGGSLKLYTPQDEVLQEVQPIGNRFICFNSELPHEVLATQRTRYSITGWMKTRSLADGLTF